MISYLLGHVHVRVGLDERLHCLDVSALRCEMQGREPLLPYTQAVSANSASTSSLRGSRSFLRLQI
eukprot:2365225-Rhodomonas_salina.1